MFYLLVLNYHIILCLQNYHMNSFVDITAKSSPYARYILGVAGQLVVTNHYPVHIRWLSIGLLGRSQSQTGCSLCSFPRTWTCLSFSSADVPSILNTDRDGKPAANHN